MKLDPMKKTRKKNATKLAVQALVNKHSRLRDCFGDTGAACISCSQWFPYEKLDGGHFIPTTSGAIRFDERNVNAQCHRCNRFLHGNQANYYVGMIRKYGQEIVDELMAQQYDTKKWTEDELQQLKIYFKEKINAINRGTDPRGQSDTGLEMSSLFKHLG